MSKKIKLKNLIKFASVLLSAAFAFNAMAQTSYYNNSYNQNNGQYVTVFEHCDYRGNSKQLSVGEYSDVRRAGIANDSISSVRVPQGLTLTMYENERGGGKATIIDRDVKCMNREWNDQASSLKVAYAQGYQQNQPNWPNSQSGFNWPQQNLTQNVRRVEFANTAIQQISKNNWQVDYGNGTIYNFREVGRDNQHIYLQNNQAQQRVEIDLADKRLSFIAPNGRNADYPITHTSARTIAPAYTNDFSRESSQPSNIIRSNCFSYKAYTRGGIGGVRFYGHDGFFQFGKKAKTGRICHKGDVVMEINKTNLNTDAIIEINGKKYHFAPGDKPDRLLNTWYRKKVTLKVGR